MSDGPLKKQKRAHDKVSDSDTVVDLGLPVQATFAEVKDFIAFCRKQRATKVQLYGLCVEFPAAVEFKAEEMVDPRTLVKPTPQATQPPLSQPASNPYQQYMNSVISPYPEHLSDEERRHYGRMATEAVRQNEAEQRALLNSDLAGED